MVVGFAFTGASYIIKSSQTYAFCSPSPGHYFIHGFPLKYYQDKLPENCFNPGGPNVASEAQFRAYEKNYFGSHFNWKLFVGDGFLWTAFTALLLSSHNLADSIKRTNPRRT